MTPTLWTRLVEMGAPFLTKYALDILEERNANELWLVGFYFNSAIQRLAASYDRIPKLLETVRLNRARSDGSRLRGVESMLRPDQILARISDLTSERSTARPLGRCIGASSRA